jgi:hypothetical protein
METLKANKDTDYGQRYHFDSITSPARYRELVPLTTYDDYTPYIEQIRAGQQSVLTADPVRMFELTSGSASASKLIPYTGTLKNEFQHGLAPWIFDLYTHEPDLQRGTAYWSVTPLTDGKQVTPAGIPIGFESDSAYLGPLGKWLVDSVLAVPDTVKDLADIDVFRYVTLLFLLRRGDLRLISVWNPTFLSLLLDCLPQWWDRLLNDIEHGTVTPPISSKTDRFHFAPNPGHARTLKGTAPNDYSQIWPRLRLISCWTDGPSAPFARQIQETFPQVILQGKGLLATEAFVSFPMLGAEGSVLSINSHFLEFIPTSGGEPCLAHQLEVGQEYCVVATTGGGFYRYQLQDVVKVVGHWEQIPCIRFTGKTDHISDWFGEKLDERFVMQTLDKVFARHTPFPAFAMLAPEESIEGFRYVLYAERENLNSRLAKDLDNALCENFHYAYCRKLGQLAALKIMAVTNGAEKYLYACQARGQKLGNIKAPALQKTTGWREWFELKKDAGNENQLG